MSTNVAEVGSVAIGSPAVGEPTSSRASTHSGAPLLEPAPGGPAESFAAAVADGHPVRVFLAAALGGYALLAGLTIAVGLLLTKVILQIGGRRSLG